MTLDKPLLFWRVTCVVRNEQLAWFFEAALLVQAQNEASQTYFDELAAVVTTRGFNSGGTSGFYDLEAGWLPRCVHATATSCCRFATLFGLHNMLDNINCCKRHPPSYVHAAWMPASWGLHQLRLRTAFETPGLLCQPMRLQMFAACMHITHFPHWNGHRPCAS